MNLFQNVYSICYSLNRFSKSISEEEKSHALERAFFSKEQAVTATERELLPYHLTEKTPRTPFFISRPLISQIHYHRLVFTQQFLKMLFFPYPAIKRLSPVKRKIKFQNGTQNRDFQGENTPKPTLSKPENTKIGESGGKKAGSQVQKKARFTP